MSRTEPNKNEEGIKEERRKEEKNYMYNGFILSFHGK